MMYRRVIQKQFMWVLLVFVTMLSSTGMVLLAESRNDGLTVLINEGEHKKAPIQYLSLVIRTGYAHDPADKAGLTALTNELLYYDFATRCSALSITYRTTAEYSVFHFSVSAPEWERFLTELDVVIRQDALLLYDRCNELIKNHQNTPRVPNRIAGSKLLELVYGPEQSYVVNSASDYRKLTITDANNRFRQIYRPNNMVVVASTGLKEGFLMKPTGRDFKSPVKVAAIPETTEDPMPKFAFYPIRDNVATVVMGFRAPKMGEPDFFTALMATKYLDRVLWGNLREENGLCYDLQVNFPYLEYSSAPFLMIGMQTLPEEVGVALGRVIDVFKELGADGGDPTVLTRILEYEQNSLKLRNALYKEATRAMIYAGLFSEPWLTDSSLYLNELDKVTMESIRSYLAGKLDRLKIVVAGPEETEEVIREVREKVEIRDEISDSSLTE